MRTIVIPTDFSDTAENAITYGVQLALHLKANITFFHAYNFPNADPFKPVYAPDGEQSISPKELPEAYASAIDARLEELCAHHQQMTKGKVECQYFSAAGMTIDQVMDTLELVEGSFVVMGTKGYSNRDEILMGSNAARMVENAPVPVMVIPAEAQYRPFTSVLFASRLLERDLEPLELLIPIISPFDAALHLIHIDEEADAEEEHDAMEGYKEIVNDHIDYPKMQFHLMKEENIIEGINDAATNYHADMIVMNTIRQQGFTGWMKRSLSKKMVFHTHLPLMVFQS